MDKPKKKRIKKYIAWICIATLVALLAAMPMLASPTAVTHGPEASILSAEAARTDIRSVLIGGGTLTAEDTVEVTIPASVKLTELLVANGDAVQAGDIIANADRISIMTAITEVQATLDYLSESLEEIRDDTAADTVTAQAGGTVKILYAQEGDSVQDVMLAHGALAVLSLDGMMAVRIDRNTNLAAGDTVCVTLSDGSEIDGKVESNLAGVLTVTVADGGYAVGASVTVTDEDGCRIGSGELYLHSPWNATAYSGTVADIPVSENASVSAGATLLTLTDTGHTAEYYQLSEQHREYEERMLTLFQMYQTEAVTAPCDGIISGLDENGTYMLSAQSGDWTLTLLANAPNGDDEAEYIHYIGRILEVGIDGLILKINPRQLSVTDYKDLSEVPTDPEAMTQEVIYKAQAPVYELTEGEWRIVEFEELEAEDILLFAGDEQGNIVWLVRVPPEEEESEPPAPAEPSEPIEPSEPTTPSEPGDTAESTAPSYPGQSGSYPQMGSSNFGGIAQEEPKYELYRLDTVTLASVTPQNTMTVQITVDEQDISRLTLGQTADITVDALTGQTFTGTVTQIGGTGTNEGGSSKFTVVLTLERSAGMLAYMNATVTLTLATAENVLTVPVAALCDIGGKTVLYTSYDEETGALGDPVVVTVGVSDGENAELLTGLTEGTTCYYAYYDTLEISNSIPTGGFLFSR